MNKWVTLVLIVLALIIIKSFIGDGETTTSAKSLEDDYSTWESPGEETFIPIGRALVKNNIRECGEYYVKKSNNTDGEYAVACTPDGNNFEYYLAWINTEKVLAIEDYGITRPN